MIKEINKENINDLYNCFEDNTEIIIESGEYFLTETVELSGSGISVKSSSKEPVIFNFKNEDYGKYGVRLEGNNFYLENIVIKNAGCKGLYIMASNSEFHNIESCYNAESGIQLKNCTGNKLYYCKSHHNCDYETVKNGENHYGANADGFSDKQYEGGKNYYFNCESYCNSDDGFDFYQRMSDDETILESCTAVGNGMSYMDLSHHERLERDKEFFSKFPEYKIRNFRISQHGNGFKLGGKNNSAKLKLINCVSCSNYKKGYDQNSNAGEITMINCKAAFNGDCGLSFRVSPEKVSIDDCASLDKISFGSEKDSLRFKHVRLKTFAPIDVENMRIEMETVCRKYLG